MPAEVSGFILHLSTTTHNRSSGHDWVLEICQRISEEAKASAPFTVQALHKNIKFTGDASRDDFPNITIPDTFLRSYDIQKIHGKETWRYMVSMKYMVEINLFHELGQNKAGKGDAKTSATTGTVALYSEDWDEDMRSGVTPPREWDDSFAQQFLQQAAGETAPGERPDEKAPPLEHLLYWVKWIQTALDEMSVESNESSDGA